MPKEDIEPKNEEKKSLKQETGELREKLLGYTQEIRAKGLPVIVLVEGWAAAGKGSLINELIRDIDPRFYNVTSPMITPESQARYPFLYTYAKSIPENGKIMFYDSGWMEDAVRKYMHREITKEQYKQRVRSVNEFERQLRDGGYLLLKLFVDIGRGEQRSRMEQLRSDFSTAWRVKDEDLWQHREYDAFRGAYDSFMEKTGKTVPWHVLDGSKAKLAARVSTMRKHTRKSRGV